MMRDISIKAVLIGLAVDIVLTIVLGNFLMVFMGASTGADISREAAMTSNPLLVLNLSVGLFGTVVGANIAGRIGGQAPVLNAVALGVLSTAIGVIMVAFASYPAWFEVASSVLVIPFAYFGGLIAAGRRT